MPDQLSSAPWLFFSFDDQSLILACNQTTSQLVGIPKEQLPGMPVSTLLTKSGHFFYQTHFFMTLQLAFRIDEVFLLFRNQAGGSFPVLVYGVRRQQQGQWINECHGAPIPQRRLLEQALIKTRQDALDMLRENKALNEVKQTLEEQQVLLDKRIRQLERANDELRQITTIVSHDLQEPVRKIALLAGIIRHHPVSLSPEHQPLVSQIEIICHSASRLITGLRNYMALNSEPLPMVSIDLPRIISQAAGEVSQGSILPNQWLEVGPLPDLSGNAKQLYTLFYQLFANSIAYRRPDEPLRVTLSADIIEENGFSALPEKYHYINYVRIRMEDNGIGFPSRYQKSVFLLLKRLAAPKQTLGLGLAICKKIIDNHFGTIRADSVPGQGTVITILLPQQHL